MRTQPALCLPMVRRVEIDDAPGVVILRVVDPRTGQEVFRMEFSPAEADRVGAYMIDAATQAGARPVGERRDG